MVEGKGMSSQEQKQTAKILEQLMAKSSNNILDVNKVRHSKVFKPTDTACSFRLYQQNECQKHHLIVFIITKQAVTVFNVKKERKRRMEKEIQRTTPSKLEPKKSLKKPSKKH